MSGHSEAICAAIESDYTTVGARRAHAALAALVAENQHLTDELARRRETLLVTRAEIQRLRDIVDKARAFVATTSYYVQHSASRPEFEALAFALLDAALDGTPSEDT